MPRVAFLYHFFAPDDVISARHYTDLAIGLRRHGWEVEAWPSNRRRRAAGTALPREGEVEGVRVRRCWRPPLAQDGTLGRVVNTAFMLGHWSLRALRRNPPDVLVVGTDPPLSVCAARVWKRVRPRTRIVHWCFDLYPDAAVADGLLREGGVVAAVARRQVRLALGRCEAVVDIGPGMRRRLTALAPAQRRETLVPWATVEWDGAGPPPPPADDDRRAHFGDARAVCLYAGRVGRAHDASGFVELARRLERERVVFVFAGVGERESEIRAAARGLSNVRFLPPSDGEGLRARLLAADFHLVSVRDRWSGVVVPTKFFAALAAGRPVVYDGPADSCLAEWIRAHGVGLDATSGSAEAAGAKLIEIVERPELYAAMSERCWQTSRRNFSKDAVIAGWDKLLRDVVGESRSAAGQDT